ncbi:MAG TPA: TrkH family potassium uptake protein [Candidatus Stackebrandtia excrementipullorum]|nr:TrkH family potassium uptake protein [Candidatus Stackebrandtia excrementipullorum]
MGKYLRHPARIVPLGFLGVVLTGTALLLTPAATEGPQSAPFITALFTATSATCITGLAVVDTSGYWSTFGEMTIVVLIQAGGFGIMTMASLLALVVAGRLGLRTRMAAQVESKSLGLGDIRRVVRRVAILSLSVEFTLACILFARLRFGYGYEIDDAVWNGVFHAVSAFNNAGFALYPDSLEGFVTDPVVLLPVAVAVILGGLGTPVLVDVARRLRTPRRWTLHTKLTLLGTAVLLPIGFFAYLVFEWSNAQTLGGLGLGDKLAAAFFSGAMPRSAGLNAIPISDITSETQLVTIILMFIGGGSASTAGGIKLTTFLLLAFVIWTELRGEPDVSIFGRTIAPASQRQALTVALLGVAAVVVGTLALEMTGDFPLNTVIFEAASAFGPVGLSMGITPELSTPGQAVLVVLMFTGRVGTVVVGTALALSTRHRRYSYPVDRPIVG